MGNEVGGAFEKARGKVNEITADIKMNMGNRDDKDQNQGYTDPEENV